MALKKSMGNNAQNVIIIKNSEGLNEYGFRRSFRYREQLGLLGEDLVSGERLKIIERVHLFMK